jgi:hypothetical protein
MVERWEKTWAEVLLGEELRLGLEDRKRKDDVRPFHL